MKRILITGATSGIGEAFVELASSQGYRVIACGRNADKLASLKQLKNVTTINFDMGNEQETAQALSNVECDIVILNAGTCEYINIENFEADLIKRVFNVNVFGTTNVIAALLPNLKSGATIIIVDSLARLLPFTKSAAYGASKSALHYIAQSLAVDLSPRKIKVKTMSPGFVETPLTDKNDFKMPMKISARKAAQYMLEGINSGHSHIYFPKRFSYMIRLLNLLPENIQHLICKKMVS